jgi:hypothetical protein
MAVRAEVRLVQPLLWAVCGSAPQTTEMVVVEDITE